MCDSKMHAERIKIPSKITEYMYCCTFLLYSFGIHNSPHKQKILFTDWLLELCKFSALAPGPVENQYIWQIDQKFQNNEEQPF
jgi:hypothetical protein